MKNVKFNFLLLSGGLFLALVYTRFVNLGWGFPYPFHPDERNMAVALQQLYCNIQYPISNIQSLRNCFNPHFFAYGQFPLYLGALMIKIWHFISRNTLPAGFDEAIMVLRVISATASTLTMWFMIGIVRIIEGKSKNLTSPFTLLTSMFIFIFSPGLIQFAHFGTTESLLMLFLTSLVYLSLLIMKKKMSWIKYIVLSSVVTGLALATKVSALPFIAIPSIIILGQGLKEKKLLRIGGGLLLMGIITAVTAMVFSPHNIISWPDFLSSIFYESQVGTGAAPVFYTQQFALTIPILFQFFSVFPYSLGLPITILFVVGFLFLPWKKEYLFLRFVFLLLFIPNAIIYAKWTRFMAPLFPLMILIAVLFLIHLFEKVKTKRLYMVITLFCILPGVAFLSIYKLPDVRFEASEWIYKNVPENSFILSEGANVVDLPITSPTSKSKNVAYQYLSFDFYNLDQSKYLQSQLKDVLGKADYIIVPSRRVFANYTCEDPTKKISRDDPKKCKYLKTTYPALNEYYKNLFSGKVGFQEIAEFSSYPQLSLFGKTVWRMADEHSEETQTVFDHPVIRIYKRI